MAFSYIKSYQPTAKTAHSNVPYNYCISKFELWAITMFTSDSYMVLVFKTCFMTPNYLILKDGVLIEPK